jgi:hypothetical protein
MTATIKEPDHRSTAGKRNIRFSSLESLGFTDVASTWSDSPVLEPDRPQGRHLAASHGPEEIADWKPEDFGRGLTRSNVRWGMTTAILVIIAGLAASGYWLSERSSAAALTARTDLATQAEALETALPLLTEFNRGLVDPDAGSGPETVDSVESVARNLFNASGSVAQTDLRSAASQAASSALDGIRLARGTYAFRSAVLPVLDTPLLETDPEVIALDEAARSFGDWQLAFDNVRTALPDGVHSAVTEQLDILSGELSSFLRRYVEALRQKDRAAVQYVLDSLTARLGETAHLLSNSVEGVQARVQARVDESVAALNLILSR